MQLPNFLGGKPPMAREEEDNVRRLRDEQPTRPQRAGPAPGEYQFYTGSVPPPMARPRGPTHEIDTANQIFAMLKDKEADERRRISEHVAFMMKLYCEDDAHSPAEGAPV